MEQKNLLRGMTRDGSARILVLNAHSIVEEMISHHHTTPTASAALGRLLTATAMMSSLMGEKNDTMTVGIQANGAAGRLIAVGDYYGNVRGYMEHPEADAPPKSNGKLNVSGIVGHGILYVVRDTGEGQPQTGTVELRSGEIAEDVAAYYAESEQVPTLCALGVLIDKDGRCISAGGVLVQLLPFADPAVVDILEENAKNLANLSELFRQGKTCQEIADIALAGIEYDPFDMLAVGYRCDCSRDRMHTNLKKLGKQALLELLAEQENEGKPRELETVCRFCGNRYLFTEADLGISE